MRVNLAAPTKTPYDATTNNNGEDETPAIVVRTREGISKKRVTERGHMSKEENKSSTRALKALTRPHDKVYLCELEAVKEKKTPDRVDHMMDLAEDMALD